MFSLRVSGLKVFDSNVSELKRLTRVTALGLALTMTAGCSTTIITDLFTPESNNTSMEGQTMDNPFMQDHRLSDEMDDRSNKTEMEFAEFDMQQMMPMEEAMPQQPRAVAVLPVPRSSYRPAYTHKALSDYAEQMTMNLLRRTKQITTDSRIAVASFVDFSQNLQTTSVLGNRLSESFITELQTYGLAIVDFKVMKAIEVTKDGDLFFDRSGPRGDMQYVLTGTMHRNERGVEVNARIIDVDDKVVVASTKGFIPHFIVSSLTPDYMLMGSR